MPRPRSEKRRHPSGYLNPSGYPDSWELLRHSTRPCKECGEEFIKYAEARPREYCSDACRKAASRKRSHE